MKKIYSINSHSFVDVITNSSSEMYISTNTKVIEFIKSIFTEDELREGHLSIIQFSQFFKEYDLQWEKEDSPERYEKRWGSFKDDDLIVTIDIEYSEMGWMIEKILEKLGFKQLWD